MDRTEIWLTIFGLTAVTIATRAFFLVLGDHFTLPARVQHALRYAPACALVALAAPEVFVQGGTVDWSIGNLKLLAAACTVALMLTVRNMVVALVAGAGVYLALRLWLG